MSEKQRGQVWAEEVISSDRKAINWIKYNEKDFSVE